MRLFAFCAVFLAGCAGPVTAPHDGVGQTPDGPQAVFICWQDSFASPTGAPMAPAVTERPFTWDAAVPLRFHVTMTSGLPARPAATAMAVLQDATGNERGRVMIGLDGPTAGEARVPDAEPGTWLIHFETQGADVRITYEVAAVPAGQAEPMCDGAT